jgi:hypothetical protein
MILSQSRSFACNGVPKQELGNQKQWQQRAVIAFAINSFQLEVLKSP